MKPTLSLTRTNSSNHMQTNTMKKLKIRAKGMIVLVIFLPVFVVLELITPFGYSVKAFYKELKYRIVDDLPKQFKIEINDILRSSIHCVRYGNFAPNRRQERMQKRLDLYFSRTQTEKKPPTAGGPGPMFL